MKATLQKGLKMSLLLLLMMTFVVVLAACGSSEKEAATEKESTEQAADNTEANKKLVGTWSGTDADGNAVKAVFNEDGSVTVNDGTKLYYSVVPDSNPLSFLLTNEVLTKENEASATLAYDLVLNSDTEIVLNDLNTYKSSTLTKQ